MKKLEKYCINKDVSLYDAIAKMEENQRGFVAIVDEELKVLGILIDPDIRRLNLKHIDFNEIALSHANIDFKFWREGESRSGALAYMRRTNFKQLPVLNEAGQLIDVLFIDMEMEQKIDTVAVIMAGGKGTRLRPKTNSCPKPMVLVRGKPMLERIIENLMQYGVSKFIISVNYLKEQIIDYFESGRKWGVTIEYLIEEEPLGTVGALKLMKEGPKAPFFLINGDIMTRVNFSHLWEAHIESDAAVTLSVRNYEVQIPFGVISLEGRMVKGIEEKPIQAMHINAGIYCLSPEILSVVKENDYMDMPDLIDRLINRNRKVEAFPIHEDWLDVGIHDDLERAQKLFN